MRSNAIFAASALIALAASACDGSPSVSPADAALADAEPAAIDAAPADARVFDGEWEPLVTAGWTFAPGQEGYLCASKTLTETVYVGAIRPLSPAGTHHTTVSLTSGGGTDNPGSPCGPMFGDFYASGVGTSELIMPAGVGLVAEKGKQLHLNLHLFNAGDAPISGTSGIEVILVPVDQVEHPARVSFYGPADFEIPSNGQVIPWSGDNALPANATVFAIFPHMHQLGVHFTAEVVRGGATLPQPLWDDAYQFESQEFALIPPVAFQPGDEIRTTCKWVNNTGATVRWGDSSKAEMCFSVLMTY